MTAFADAIRVPDSRGRELEVAFTMHVQPFIHSNSVTPAEAVRMLVGSCANLLFATCQSFEDAKEGADMAARELRRRVYEAGRR